MFAVILDANVLLPANPCDTLLRTAIAGLYRAHWSDDILEEVARALVRLGVDEGRARRRISTMKAIPMVTLVAGYQALIPAMPCAEGDRHVHAAAVVAGAELIVTNNLQDFPALALAPYNMQDGGRVPAGLLRAGSSAHGGCGAAASGGSEEPTDDGG